MPSDRDGTKKPLLDRKQTILPAKPGKGMGAEKEVTNPGDHPVCSRFILLSTPPESTS
jgi:hypothetical protein